MIKVVFMRHGEASQGFGLSDHERPLTERGRQRVDEQANNLHRAGIIPDLILASDALRTQQTTEILQRRFPDCETEFTHELYLADYDKLLNDLGPRDFDSGVLILVGHNPGWSDIAGRLMGSFIGLEPGDFVSCVYDQDSPLDLAITEMGRWQQEEV